jgi:hypothetical protein
LDKLTQFGGDIVNAEVFLRLDKDQERENKISEISWNYLVDRYLQRNRVRHLKNRRMKQLMRLKNRLPSINKRRGVSENSIIKNIIDLF